MRVSDVVWVPVQGTWVRHTVPGLPGIDAHAGGPRWLRPGTRGLYLADGEETAWAELYKALAESGRAPLAAMPRDLYRVAVSLDRVADLSREHSRRAPGLPRMRPTRRQWPALQTVGLRLAEQAAQGVLYASAARARSLCLCVFDAGLAGMRVQGEPVRVIAPPPLPRGMRA